MPEKKSRTLVSFRDGSYKEIECDAWKHSQWIHFTLPDGSTIHVNPANVNYLHERPRPARATGSAYDRGRLDYAQDRCENVPFASVGGEQQVKPAGASDPLLVRRSSMSCPDYVNAPDRDAYMSGYCLAASNDGWNVKP